MTSNFDAPLLNTVTLIVDLNGGCQEILEGVPGSQPTGKVGSGPYASVGAGSWKAAPLALSVSWHAIGLVENHLRRARSGGIVEHIEGRVGIPAHL